MPTEYIEKMAKKHNKSTEDAENLWDKAKEQAEKQDHKDDFDYITAIFKKMIGENKSMLTFDKFIKEESVPATTTTGPAIATHDTVLGYPSYKISHDSYLKLLQGKQKKKRWNEILDDLDLTSELKKRLYARKKTFLQCEKMPQCYIEMKFK